MDSPGELSDRSIEPEKDDGLDLVKIKSIAQLMSPTHEVFFVIVICAGQLWTQYALGQVISILHVIGDYYGITNPGTLSWLIAGYSLTVGTFILLSGRMGDIFGYKKMLLIGYSWFALWSMVAGLAVYSNSVLFIFARVFQGIGPSIVLPNSLAILGAAYAPGPKKAMAFSLFGATAPNGSILGAVFSSLFALSWWPWAFWFSAMGITLTTIAAYYVIPDTIQEIPPAKPWRQTLHDIDLFGGLIGVTALVLFNFAWNQSGVVGWSAPYVIVTLILGALLAPLFFWYEHYHASSPLIPLEDLNSDTAFVLGCIACGWASFGIWFYYIWQFSEELRGATPILTSAWLSPSCISGLLAALLTGKLLAIVRPAWVMTIAMMAFTVGTILVATAPVEQTYWTQVFLAAVITPWGMDMRYNISSSPSDSPAPNPPQYTYTYNSPRLTTTTQLPRSNPDPLQQRPQTQTRRRRQPGQHSRQLLHLARPRVRGHRGGKRERRKYVEGVPWRVVHGDWAGGVGHGGQWCFCGKGVFGRSEEGEVVIEVGGFFFAWRLSGEKGEGSWCFS